MSLIVLQRDALKTEGAGSKTSSTGRWKGKFPTNLGPMVGEKRGLWREFELSWPGIFCGEFFHALGSPVGSRGEVQRLT